MIFGMTYYQICMYFLMYSFLGWCLEVIYHALTVGKIVNRGFLNGPVCPVYGFGMLAVCAMVHFIPTDASTGEANVLGVFFGGMILCTAVEFAAGYILYHLFHARWWDYSGKPLNIGGYICPLYSVLWGIACVIVVKYVHPLIQHASDVSIPEKYGWPIMLVLYIIYFVDFVATVLSVAGLNKKLEELDKLDASLKVVSDGLSEAIGGTTLKAQERAEKAKVQGALARAELRDGVKEYAGVLEEEHLLHKAQAKGRRLETAENVRRAAETARASLEEEREDARAAYEKKRNEAYEEKKRLEARRQEIFDGIAAHRHAGAARLLTAFPGMKHKDHEEEVRKLQLYLQEKGRKDEEDQGNDA